MPTADNTILSLQHISKSFSGNEVLHDVCLDVAKGEFLTLLGPSGCGKTTTIRLIAGLDTPENGQIWLNGKDVTNIEPHKRNVNTVFQNYALFPHMNVYKNVAYGLQIQHVAKDEIQERVTSLLKLVQMGGFERRRPTQLSGGQRQRIAIARSLINNPDILLLDEPLGALDLQLRRQMQAELKQMQSNLGITFIYITHDQEEALNMSDRIVIMNEGRIEQIGVPEDIYDRPTTKFAAQFIGESNVIDVSAEEQFGDMIWLSLHGEKISARTNQSIQPGEEVSLSIRPDDVYFGPDPNSIVGFSLRGTIISQQYIGSTMRTTIDVGGTMFITNYRGSQKIAAGGEIWVWWAPNRAAMIRNTPV